MKKEINMKDGIYTVMNLPLDMFQGELMLVYISLEEGINSGETQVLHKDEFKIDFDFENCGFEDVLLTVKIKNNEVVEIIKVEDITN